MGRSYLGKHRCAGDILPNEAKNMAWTKRLVLALPFAVAAVLNVLVKIARPLHWRSEHSAGYCFLFGAPWGWLLDHGWFATFASRWLELILLWIPALLYSACLWLMMRALAIAFLNKKPGSRTAKPLAAKP
jgi:hypothetical protein